MPAVVGTSCDMTGFVASGGWLWQEESDYFLSPYFNVLKTIEIGFDKIWKISRHLLVGHVLFKNTSTSDTFKEIISWPITFN